MPHQTYQGDRDISNAQEAPVPAAGAGLYKVVWDVSPGTVSGYGTVHVPVFSMDFAVTTRMTPSCTDEVYFQNTNRGTLRSAAGGLCLNRANGLLRKTGFRIDHADSWNERVRAGNSDTLAWHENAPIFKRVNMVVKTDGLATISNDCNDNYINANAFGQGTGEMSTGAAPRTQFSFGGLGTAVLTDIYMEPGEMYSVIVMPQEARTGFGHCSGADFINSAAANTGNTRDSDTVDPSIQTGKNFRFAISRDVSRTELTQGGSSTQAFLTFASLGDRKNWAELDMPNKPTDVGSSGVGRGANSAPARAAGKPRPDQQDFQGTVIFQHPASANQETFTIKAHATSFRELIPRWRLSTYPATTSQVSPFPRGVSDWDGLDSTETRVQANLCHKDGDATCRTTAPAGMTTAQVGFAMPDTPQTMLLLAGQYDMTHTPDVNNANQLHSSIPTPNMDSCFNSIPPAQGLTLEAGKRYHYYVMNQFGCVRRPNGDLRSSAFTGALQGVLVEVQPFTIDGRDPFSGAVLEESAASTLVASSSLLLAALVAILALVY